jgi:hypothetical protein
MRTSVAPRSRVGDARVSPAKVKIEQTSPPSFHHLHHGLKLGLADTNFVATDSANISVNFPDEKSFSCSTILRGVRVLRPRFLRTRRHLIIFSIRISTGFLHLSF